MDGSFPLHLNDSQHEHDVWTGLVLNFIGPNDTQGIRVYSDGVQAGYVTMKLRHSDTISQGEGQIVLGRIRITSNTGIERDHFTYVQMDELLFYNHVLTEDEIILLSQQKRPCET